MRTRRIKRIAIIPLAFIMAGTLSAGEPDYGISVTKLGNNTCDLRWDSSFPHRIYYVKGSHDLNGGWRILPALGFGSGTKTLNVPNEGRSRYFYRLHFRDAEWVTSLQQARDFDFDLDGIPTAFEVEILSTDPFDKMSAGGDGDNGGSGDGLSDGWELYFFGNLTTADPSAVGLVGGLTNRELSDLGLNPNIDYSDPGASQRSKYTYDLTGRLTSVSAPLGTATYTPDEEGNLDSN